MMRIEHHFSKDLSFVEEILKYVCTADSKINELVGGIPYNTTPICNAQMTRETLIGYGFINGFYGLTSHVTFANMYDDKSTHVWDGQFTLYKLNRDENNILIPCYIAGINEENNLNNLILTADADAKQPAVVINHTDKLPEPWKINKDYSLSCLKTIKSDLDNLTVSQFIEKYGAYAMSELMDVINERCYKSKVRVRPFLPGSQESVWDEFLWQVYMASDLPNSIKEKLHIYNKNRSKD